MKPELGKEVECDPELADFIWNGSDALLPMNQTNDDTDIKFFMRQTTMIIMKDIRPSIVDDTDNGFSRSKQQ